MLGTVQVDLKLLSGNLQKKKKKKRNIGSNCHYPWLEIHMIKKNMRTVIINNK